MKFINNMRVCIALDKVYKNNNCHLLITSIIKSAVWNTILLYSFKLIAFIIEQQSAFHSITLIIVTHVLKNANVRQFQRASLAYIYIILCAVYAN